MRESFIPPPELRLALCRSGKRESHVLDTRTYLMTSQPGCLSGPSCTEDELGARARQRDETRYDPDTQPTREQGVEQNDQDWVGRREG